MLKKLVLLLGLLALCAEASAQARSDADLTPGTIKGLPVRFIPKMPQVCASITTGPSTQSTHIAVFGTNNCNFKVEFFGMQPGLDPVKRGWGSPHNPLIDIAAYMMVGKTRRLGDVLNAGPILDFYCQSGPLNTNVDFKNKHGDIASPQLDGDPRTGKSRCFIWWDHAP